MAVDKDGNEIKVEVEVPKEEPKDEEKEEKKGLTEEEILALVEKARKEEKDKLYPKIEELTTTTKTLQDSIRAEQDEKAQIKKEAEEAAEARRIAKLSDTERTNEVLRRLEEQLTNEQAERTQFKQELEARDRKDRINRYRAQALQNAGDEIVAELVSGDSEEEIDRSIKTAKARYEQIIAAEKKKRGEQIKKDLGSTSPSTDALEEQEIQARGLANIDTDKYREDPEYRAQLQNELEKAVEKAYGR